MYLTPLKDWLPSTGFLLFCALILFVVGLLAGYLIEVPHSWISAESTFGHRTWSLVAASVFSFGAYHGMKFFLAASEVTDFELQHLGTSLIVGASLPIGFMLTYQPQALTTSGAALFSIFFFIPILFLSCGILLLVLTPLLHTPCLRRFCTVRTGSCS